MTFWKSSKRREGAISDPKILVADLSTSRKKRTTVFGNKGGAGEGVTGRVRRDPGTRPVPNFFSSTRPVPTRKLKMTGYRVIKFHFESNKTWEIQLINKTDNNPIAKAIFFCHSMRQMNKNRCSNFLSLPEAYWLDLNGKVRENGKMLLVRWPIGKLVNWWWRIRE